MWINQLNWIILAACMKSNEIKFDFVRTVAVACRYCGCGVLSNPVPCICYWIISQSCQCVFVDRAVRLYGSNGERLICRHCCTVVSFVLCSSGSVAIGRIQFYLWFYWLELSWLSLKEQRFWRSARRQFEEKWKKTSDNKVQSFIGCDMKLSGDSQFSQQKENISMWSKQWSRSYSNTIAILDSSHSRERVCGLCINRIAQGKPLTQSIFLLARVFILVQSLVCLFNCFVRRFE